MSPRWGDSTLRVQGKRIATSPPCGGTAAPRNDMVVFLSTTNSLLRVRYPLSLRASAHTGVAILTNIPGNHRGSPEGELPQRGKRGHPGVHQPAGWFAMTYVVIGPANYNLPFRRENGIYFFPLLVYDNGEQSRRPRVKCRRDGELPDGRRNFSTMGSPHPLLHMGHPPLCSNDTRSGKWSAVFFAVFPYG